MLIAVVDTESTGIGPRDEAISIGILLVKVDERGAVLHEVDSYHALREPRVPIHPMAYKVHRLKLEQLRGQSFNMVRVNAMLGMAGALVAHNARHDSRMLTNTPGYVARQTWRCSWRQWVWKVATENKKLDTICAALEVERPEPHNALTDARALLQCLSGRTGKTARSKTYLGTLVAKQPWPIESERDDCQAPVALAPLERTFGIAEAVAASVLSGLVSGIVSGLSKSR